MAKQDEKPELSTDEKFMLVLEALAQRKNEGIDASTLQAILAANATGVQKALRPENESHPGISAMSYPEGDRAKPRDGILKYPFFYNNYPMHKFPETEHWRELELAAQVKPGEYTVIRKDASLMTVTVKGEKNANGDTTAIRVEFPISREEKWLIPPKSVVLYQLVYNDHPKRRFLEAMQEYLVTVMGGEAVEV